MVQVSVGSQSRSTKILSGVFMHMSADIIMGVTEKPLVQRYRLCFVITASSTKPATLPTPLILDEPLDPTPSNSLTPNPLTQNR